MDDDDSQLSNGLKQDTSSEDVKAARAEATKSCKTVSTVHEKQNKSSVFKDSKLGMLRGS